MTLGESQQREINQFLLVARKYLELGDPGHEAGAVGLSATKDAFRSGACVSVAEWALTMKAAHLASAAIRLTSIDEVLARANERRALYRECREYFGKDLPIIDPRGSSCSEWFHVMLRDAVAHNEPLGERAPRYKARQRCIETTTFGDAHSRLERAANELAELLAQKGIVLSELAKPSRP